MCSAGCPVLKNGQFDARNHFYCSNEGLVQGPPKKVVCAANNFCIVSNNEPACVHNYAKINGMDFCTAKTGCVCSGKDSSKGRAVMCSEGQQCLNSGAKPLCVSITPSDTECAEPQGCYCFRESALRNTKSLEAIPCQYKQYCSYDEDGPLCLTPKIKKDKDAVQTATEKKGIACALRKEANSPVTIVHCPMYFTCAWADEDVAVCEAPKTKILLLDSQICTNINAGCVCPGGQSTVDCRAGQLCHMSKTVPTCTNESYLFFEAPKGLASVCGTWASRNKLIPQYCSLVENKYKDANPADKVLLHPNLLTLANGYSRTNEYFLYDNKIGKKFDRALSTWVKI